MDFSRRHFVMVSIESRSRGCRSQIQSSPGRTTEQAERPLKRPECCHDLTDLAVALPSVHGMDMRPFEPQRSIECRKSVMVFVSKPRKTDQNQSTRGSRKRLTLHI